MALFTVIAALGLISGTTYLYPNVLPQSIYNALKVAYPNRNDGFYGKGFQGHEIFSPELVAFIGETMQAANLNGLSVAVVPKNEKPELKTWGYRSEEGEEMTPDTLFHMASVSKAFCASALGILIDDFANGRNATSLPPGLSEITWHTRVKDLLPGEWELMDEWASERANLKDILSHVSGVPRHDYAWGPDDTPLDMVKRLRYLRPAFELRERWSYNNIMYMAAAHIISKYADQPYTSFVEERIFTPLGMASSTFSPQKAAESGKFTQGWTKEGRLIPEWVTEEVAFTIAGTGGVISNAIDMSKWIAMWLNKGLYEGKTIIPMTVYQNASFSYTILRDHPIDADNSIDGYGMGWSRHSYRGHDVVAHTGALPGFSTRASFFPNDDFGVLVFANGGDQESAVMHIFERIVEKVLRLDPSTNPHRSKDSFSGATIKHATQNRTLSLPDFAGTYVNPGYGSFTLCSSSSISPYCSQVHSDFSAVDGAQENPFSSPSLDLLAAWPRVFSSHVRLRHVMGLVFDVYVTTLFPHGYGRNSTPFETAGMGMSAAVAEFVLDNGRVVGLGLSGLVEGVTERARLGTTVQDKSEVWFDKI